MIKLLISIIAFVLEAVLSGTFIITLLDSIGGSSGKHIIELGLMLIGIIGIPYLAIRLLRGGQSGV
jgi:CRISPR/Cas system CMR subunit Cmr6 (Cas7 group RAMP superfamily)